MENYAGNTDILVSAGEQIGTVGDTGNARGKPITAHKGSKKHFT